MTAPTGINPGQIRGLNVRWLKNTASMTDWEMLLDKVQPLGCNAVAINTHHLMAVQALIAAAVPTHVQQTNGPAVEGVDKAAVLVYPAQGYYPRDRLLYADINQDGTGHNETPDIVRVKAAAQRAQDRGLHVVIKPMVDCHWPFGGRGGWRGYVRIRKRLIERFFDDMLYMLWPYAQLADELGADLCIGTEWYLLTTEHGSAFWTLMAQRLRELGYSGVLTYAANWGPRGAGAEFRLMDWTPFDYIGIDWYEPMAGMADHAATWQHWAAEIAVFANVAQRPVVFTEVGWPNTDYADTDPFGGTWPPGPFDTSKSLPLAQAFRAATKRVLHGYYVWDVQLGSVGAPGTHNILDTPLAPVLLAA